MVDLGSSTADCTKTIITFAVMELAAGVVCFLSLSHESSLFFCVFFFFTLLHIDFDLSFIK